MLNDLKLWRLPVLRLAQIPGPNARVGPPIDLFNVWRVLPTPHRHVPLRPECADRNE
jgi:hypothetical protein